jgi:hypothetical protein
MAGHFRGITSRTRRGILLFEVVLALAIFIGALTAISQVLRTGSQAAIRAQLFSEAQLRGEQKLSEALSGVLPLEAADHVAFEDDDAWQWSLQILDSGTVNLLRLELLIEHLGPARLVDTRYQLVRLLRDPKVYDDAAAAGAGTTP